MQDLSFPDMQEQIKKTGGLFYQYRPCRRDADTIYDIENIQHGVVYARTPLDMNDPFDSQIGYSSEKLYEETVSAILDAMPLEKSRKDLLFVLIKYKCLGQMAELIEALKGLKHYIKETRESMHLSHASSDSFIERFKKRSYGKLPQELKDYFSKETYIAVVSFLDSIAESEISEEFINKLIGVDTLFQNYYSLVCHVQKDVYPNKYRDFLSTITVSCFSASGWDNQLMWSHYANSYSGICIEYDFNLMKDFIGLMYPVEYSSTRPNITLKDMGIMGFDLHSENKVVTGDINILLPQ